MKLITVYCLILLCMAGTAQEFDVYLDERDGTAYKTVKIGSQVWMADNMNYAYEGPEAVFSNNTGLADIFGRLYCWEVAVEVCPDGWHLPTEEDWLVLSRHLGGEKVAGGSMKNMSPYWVSLHEEASNESGFSALPGGYLEKPKDASYPFMGEMGFFWSTRERSRTEAWFYYVKYDNTLLKAGNGKKEFGMSVRCLQD
jgi:uncharacterized protein (TIGR02145 family)